VLGTIVGAYVLYYAILNGGLNGAIYGLVFMPAIISLFSVPYVLWRRVLSGKQIIPRYNRSAIVKLLRYSGMMVVTVSTLPVAQIVIRKFIEHRAGWEDVGYWQGVTKISDAYLQFVIVVLANYYLPRLSSKTVNAELKQEVYGALRLAFPVTLAMSMAVYVFKEQIIIALFSNTFMPMREFFLFQMIGDCLKVCSYTILYVAIARAMTKLCIFAEILQSISLLLLAYFFLDVFGPVGITYAYALNYLIYFAIAFFLFRQYISEVNR
jgi:O-antigen/teichoic acid export membrane protein